MNKKSLILNKILNFLVSFLLIFQSFAPTLLYAQEVSPSPLVESTPAPVASEGNALESSGVTPEPTAEPTVEPTSSPTPETSQGPQPSVLPKPSPEITPSPVPSESPIPGDQTQNTPAPEPTTGQPNAPPSENPTPTPSAEVSPLISPLPSIDTTQPINGHLSATIIKDTAIEEIIPTLDIDPANTFSSASLTTDKGDYAPTDTAVISGTEFPKDTDLKLIFIADNYRFEAEVKTDDQGSFIYMYQLDGTYRPLYQVEAQDLSGQILATVSFTDSANPSADLDQCANDPVPSPNTDGCSSNASDWVNGNLGPSKSSYFENDSIPYRLKFENLSLSSHTVTIEWDTTKSDKHAIDYLTTFNRTVTTANPCLGVSGCSSSSTYAIPADPQVTGAGVTPDAGNFTFYGGTITSVSVYSYPNGTGFTGDKSARISITFTASVANPVLAWGGHIADRDDWGADLSAVAIPGSPYHTRLIDLDGSGGNQDRSLSADAVIFPSSITIIKNAVPDSVQDFGFTTTGGLSPSTFILDDDSDSTNSNTQSYSNLLVTTNTGNDYTITEGSISGWALSFGIPVCSVASANGGTQSGNTSTRTVSITLQEGEDVSCTFINDLQQATLTLQKTVTNNNGGTAAAADWTLSASGPTTISGATGSTTVTNATVSIGTYIISETGGPSGYTAGSWSCVKNGGIPITGSSITLAAADSAVCTINNDDIPPQLTVIKHVANDNGGTAAAGDFNMNVTGTNVSDSSFPGVESPGTTVTLDAGSYSVDEDVFSGYSKTLSTDCSGTIAVGQTKTCTITNNDQNANLVVIKKVINDNGGTKNSSDFTMHISGTAVGVGVSFAGADSPGVTKSVNAGTFTLTEDSVAGYAESTSGDCSGSIALGQTKTCTITNDDIAPSLTLLKNVTTDNGGTAVNTDWTLTATGTGGSPTNLNGTTPVSSGTGFKADTYTLGENSGPSGYTASQYSCVKNGGDAVLGDTITLGLSDTATCTINNNDVAPTLKLVKSVTNNNGGNAAPADWTLTAAGEQGFNDAGNSTTFHTVKAGVGYALSESSVPGYTAGGWSCSGGSLVGSTITLGLNQNVTCTITNDDAVPALHLRKTVTKDNGGTANVTDWTLTATGTVVSPTNLSGTTPVDSGSTFKADTYALAETGGPSGYTSGAWDCGSATMPDVTHVTVPLGGDVTCTVNNNDNAPSLTLQKIVVNDNGGTAVASNWSLYASMDSVGIGGTGPTVSSDSTFSAGTYDLLEGGPSGYTPSAWVCVGGTQEGDTITLGLGQSATCTITNDDNAPSLTLNKIVVKDNGGTASESDWTLTATGPTSISGPGTSGSADVVSGSSFKAGTYTLSESGGPSGYIPSSWSCTNEVTVDSNNQITMGLGQSTICSITNNDQAGQIKIVKNTVGGDDTFGFTVLGPTPATLSVTTASGTGDTGFLSVNFGSYSISETTIPDGWDQTGASCDSGTPASFTVPNGGIVTCTFTNTRKGHLIVQKTTLPASDISFSITASGSGTITGGGAGTITDTSDKDYEVTPGTYSVSESVPSGWDKTADTCQNITVAAGETKYCEITNTKRSHIIIIKDAVPNNAQNFTFHNNFGNSNPDSFQLDDDSNGALPDTRDFEVIPGNYSVSEDSVADWKLGNISCIDPTQNSSSNLPAVPSASIDVAAGETVTCTFTNNKLGSIVLNKNTIGGDGTFDFVMTGQSLPNNAQLTTASGSATQTFTGIDPENTYSINEDVPPGWDLTNTSCVNENGVTKNNSSFTINNGGTVTCTFVNTKKGSIIVEKQTDPDQASESFSFTGDAAGNISDGEQIIINNLAPGTYSSTESEPSGWDLTGISCDDTDSTGNLETKTATFNVSAGEVVKCTFRNTERAHITIQKTTNPDGEPDLFTISASGSGTIYDQTSPYISDSGDSILTVSPGTYSITEDSLDGWDMTDNDCADVVVGAGEDKSCTITNTKLGTIIVEKQTNPAEAAQSFEFLPSYGPNFFLSDGESNNSGLLQPGIYSVSENTPSGWESRSTCSDGSSVDSINLGPAEIVTCTFTNTREEGKIRVEKIIDADGDLQTTDDQTPGDGWSFDVNGAGEDTSDPDSGLTNENGLLEFSSLKTGEYEIIETVQDGYHIISASCSADEESEVWEFNGEDRIEGIEVNSDEEVRCTFINTRDTGSVTIIKNIDNNGDGDTTDEEDIRNAQGWTYDIAGGDQDNSTGGSKTLATGSYIISEDQKAGHRLLGWSCSNEQTGTDNSISIEVTEGDDLTCTFTNQVLSPELTITKTNDKTGIDVSAGANVLYTLTISLTGSPLSGVLLTDLPPFGFKYRPGSWTAVSSMRGDLKPEITGEPVYASPGTWALGDMVSGETVTLTYIADIDGATDPGLYKDVAWARGTGFSSTVLANDDSGFFVGTEVNVVKSESGSIGVNLKEEEIREVGEVLGASTSLPATGANALWLVLASLLIAGGVGMVIKGKGIKKKYE